MGRESRRPGGVRTVVSRPAAVPGTFRAYVAERLEDRVERFPIARGFSAPAIDDKIIRLFRDLRVEIILDHAIRGFAEPVLAGEISSARRADSSGSRHDIVSLVK